MDSRAVRTLFIVSRGHRDLYVYLTERFANDPAVEVVLDRRNPQGPPRPGHPQAVEAPGSDRRLRPEVEAELRTRSHAILTLPMRS
jgi:hypothetical protein